MTTAAAEQYNRARPYTASMWRAIQETVGVTTDGVPGPNTASAVAAYQAANELPADGKCGPYTLDHMGHSPIRLDGGGFSWVGGMSICADGGRVYNQTDTGLDYLANAGYPGNWWGIETDASGEPTVLPDGFYVSTTAMVRGWPKGDQRRYVDALSIPYVVLPKNIGDMIPSSMAAALRKGDRASVTYQGRRVCAIYAEVGPAKELDPVDRFGEASVASALAVFHDPFTTVNGIKRASYGITSHSVEYRIMPGTSSQIAIIDTQCGQQLTEVE
jgi:peptidoglycan hydrolase-like protein with peptidoglycan-binding domain